MFLFLYYILTKIMRLLVVTNHETRQKDQTRNIREPCKFRKKRSRIKIIALQCKSHLIFLNIVSF